MCILLVINLGRVIIKNNTDVILLPINLITSNIILIIPNIYNQQ